MHSAAVIRHCHILLALLAFPAAALHAEPGNSAPVPLAARTANPHDLLPTSYQQPAATTGPTLSDAAAAGQAAFYRSCTNCHDEQRSLQKRKTYAGWLATVQRMASKDGADISSADVAPIAAYLTTVAGAGPSASGDSATAGDLGASGWTLAGTISTLHRSASDEYLLENPGFFADVWVTAGYQSTGPWQATATACTSCHARDNGGGNAWSIELVEGSATLDLRHLFLGCKCEDGRELLLKAGRFVVPFGAFSAMSHPGNYRTVTNPLMFNMGRRVLVPGFPPVQPVLPAPFSDEGIDLVFRQSFFDEWMFTFDAYAVNGLQGIGPNIFNRSRAYFDNNEEPSPGARMTIGANYVRFGASVLTGNLQDQQIQPRVYYTLAGADVTTQISDRLRFYFEYAQRRQNSVFAPGTKETTSGIVTQFEFQLWQQPSVSILFSYDTLEHRSTPLGNPFVERFTTGLNVSLPGGSLLMINHERWMPRTGDDADVVGVRWSVSL